MLRRLRPPSLSSHLDQNPSAALHTQQECGSTVASTGSHLHVRCDISLHRELLKPECNLPSHPSPCSLWHLAVNVSWLWLFKICGFVGTWGLGSFTGTRRHWWMNRSLSLKEQKSALGQEASSSAELSRAGPGSGFHNPPVVLYLGRFLAFQNSLHLDGPHTAFVRIE